MCRVYAQLVYVSPLAILSVPKVPGGGIAWVYGGMEMKLTRKGFFGTLVSAIFGAPEADDPLDFIVCNCMTRYENVSRDYPAVWGTALRATPENPFQCPACQTRWSRTVTTHAPGDTQWFDNPWAEKRGKRSYSKRLPD